MIIAGIASSIEPHLASVLLNQWALSCPQAPLLLHAHLDGGIVIASHGKSADVLIHLDRYGHRDRIGQCRGWMDNPHNAFVQYAKRKGLPVDGSSTRRFYLGMMLDELSCGSYPEAVIVWTKPLDDPLAIRVQDVVEYLERAGVAAVRVERERSVTIQPERAGRIR